ncbi:MAG: flippase [Candidatus Marinimicrobia bacterium]|nr:flippase [Candidatus Neomarinimicrobiota bacterium]
MSTTHRIVKSTTTLLLSQSIYFIAGLLVMTLAARILGVKDFGGFMFATSLVAFIEITTNLGINLLLVREIARNKEDIQKYWSNIFIIKIALSIISTFTIISISILFSFTPLIVIVILAISQIFNSMVIFNNAVFQAMEKVQYQLYSTINEKIVTTILAVIVLFKGYGLTGLASIFLLSRIISWVVSMVLMNRYVAKIIWYLDLIFIRRIIRQSLPFALFLIMGTVYFQMDSILLAYFMGNEAVGYYQAALRLVVVILLLPDVIAKSILPVMSHLFKHSINDLNNIFYVSYKIMIIISIPISFGLYILAKPIILLLFGQDYQLSVQVLQILCWIIVMRFIGLIPGTYLTAINKQKIRSYTVTIAAIISITMNIILIPKFGIIGVSITNLISNFLVVSIYIVFIQLTISNINLIKILITPILSALISFLFFSQIYKSNSLYTLILTISGYFSLLILFKSITKSEVVKFFTNIRQLVGNN